MIENLPIDLETLALKLSKNKQSAFEFQERRHEDWTENYTLGRDKVRVNRLTQRQSVNMPLMKQSIKTVLANIDDPPELYFENLDNDKDREIFYNEYWRKMAEINKLPVKDVVDKKQVCYYGRSFKKLNIKDRKFYFEIIDNFDMLIERYADPADLDTAQFQIHQHIYRTLKEIENNPDYDIDGVIKLKEFYATEEGLMKSAENLESAQAKGQRLEEMGVPDVEHPLLGEVYVELNENYIKLWDEAKKKFVIYLVVTSNTELNPETETYDVAILMAKPLEEVIGKTVDHYWQDHYPFSSWADDVERTDVWSDGIADILRNPNKVVNAWYSQLVENRTLRNFGMYFYNSSLGQEGFAPQTFEPVPFGWYPVPGDPNVVMKPVTIPDLSESLDELNFVIQLAEKATAATAIQQGVSQPQKITLGEVEILQRNVTERIKSMSKFYNESWRDFGEKFIKMVEAAGNKLEAVKIYKTSYRGNIFSKEIKPSDWMSKSGYRVRVEQAQDREQKKLDNLQKLNAAMGVMPDNNALRKIYKRELLELAELNAEETRQVMDEEKQKEERTVAGGGLPMTGQPATPAVSPMAGGMATLPKPAGVMPVGA